MSEWNARADHKIEPPLFSVGYLVTPQERDEYDEGAL